MTALWTSGSPQKIPPAEPLRKSELSQDEFGEAFDIGTIHQVTAPDADGRSLTVMGPNDEIVPKGRRYHLIMEFDREMGITTRKSQG